MLEPRPSLTYTPALAATVARAYPADLQVQAVLAEVARLETDAQTMTDVVLGLRREIQALHRAYAAESLRHLTALQALLPPECQAAAAAPPDPWRPRLVGNPGRVSEA